MQILPVTPVEAIVMRPSVQAGLPDHITPTLPVAAKAELPPNIIPTFPDVTLGIGLLNNNNISNPERGENPGVVPPWLFPVGPSIPVDDDTPRIL